MAVINYILGIGPSVMMPIIIFILCMIFRMPIGRSLRAAILIGIGFVAINLVIGLLVNTLGPVSQAMVKNLGVRLNVIDVGWPVAAAISFGTSSVVPWVFVLGILLNLILIVVRFTKTLDVDMWNYWHFIFTAAFVFVITQSLLIALGLALITELIILKLADLTAPIVQDYYGLPGISLPHTETVNWAPISWTLNKAIDRIPGLNKLRADPGTIQDRFGVIGEPMFIGLVLGAVIGILAYFPSFGTDFSGALAKILVTAITLGAVMLVLPRMVAILMEGLTPLSEGAQTFISSRFPGRELYIGLDAAIVVGFANNMTVALIMIPITLLLAVGMSFIGWNQMLPFTDLAVLPFTVIWASTWSRGNIVRGVIIATIYMTAILSFATFLAPMTLALAKGAHFAIPSGALSISCIDCGSHVLPFVLVFPFALSQLGSYGVGFVIWTGLWVLFTIASYVIFFNYCRTHVAGMDDKALYVVEEEEVPISAETDIATGQAGS